MPGKWYALKRVMSACDVYGRRLAQTSDGPGQSKLWPTVSVSAENICAASVSGIKAAAR